MRIAKEVKEHCKYLIINHSMEEAKKQYDNSIAMECLRELGYDGYWLAYKDLSDNRTIPDRPVQSVVMRTFLQSLKRNYKGLYSDRYNKDGKISKK